jgi:outer membrane protein OmpA-like peptidoglycan-associated protein
MAHRDRIGDLAWPMTSDSDEGSDGRSRYVRRQWAATWELGTSLSMRLTCGSRVAISIRVVVAALLLFLTGCGGQAAPMPPLAILLSPDAHEPQPTLSPADRALVRARAEHDGTVSIFVDTRLVSSLDLAPRRRNGEVEHGPRRSVLVGERVTAFEAAVRAATNVESTGDLLAGLVAVSKLDPNATILVLDSGLTTVAPADRRALGWELPPEQFVQDLKHRGFLPNLTGRRVIFGGLGRTAGAQPPLPTPQQGYLRDTWLAVCNATGATCTVSDEPRPDLPPLSRRIPPIVPVPAVTTTPGPSRSNLTNVPTALLFTAGRCELRDRQAAASLLAPVLTKARTGAWTLQISGRTANWGSLSYQLELSRCRANSVKALLIANGVPRASIVRVEGVGSSADPSRASLDQHGRFDERRAQRLRRVVITLTPR